MKVRHWIGMKSWCLLFERREMIADASVVVQIILGLVRCLGFWYLESGCVDWWWLSSSTLRVVQVWHENPIVWRYPGTKTNSIRSMRKVGSVRVVFLTLGPMSLLLNARREVRMQS